MAEYRIKLVANTWTDLAAQIVTTAAGNHLILRPDRADFDIGVKAAVAPTVAGQAMVKDAAVEVIMAANAAVKVWVRSVSGGYLEVDDIGGKTVVCAPSVALA